MTVYAGRPYSDPGDREALTRLISGRPPARAGDFPGIADLQEMLGVAAVRAGTRLWENSAGRAVGFSMLSMDEDEARLSFESAPEEAAAGLDAQMLDWTVTTLGQARRESRPSSLTTACREDNLARRELLVDRGFHLEPVHTLHLVRPLAEPIPEPRLPAGFTLRHGVGADEVEAWVALHRAAFGTESMTAEYRLAMIAAPSYDPALDLVAVAPDGTLAAYVLCSISPEENALSGRQDGWTDPVATHPAYRRRGLARALLLTGLRLLRERGMDAARLGTSSDNVAMWQAAMGVGYRVEARTLFFTLSLL